jgi:hypothetical protein
MHAGQAKKGKRQIYLSARLVVEGEDQNGQAINIKDPL